MSEHVQQSIKVCNQRLYLLCQLKKISMSCDCLNVVFDAIVLSKLLYTSPAWFGFISVERLNMIQKLLGKKRYKWGLTNRVYKECIYMQRYCSVHVIVSCLN